MDVSIAAILETKDRRTILVNGHKSNFVDTLLMKFDQQALEAYMSSTSEGSATDRARRSSKTGSPKLSPEHAANNSSAKQSSEAIEPRHGSLPTVIGGSSPPVKHSRNAERRQRCRERR